MILTLLDLEHKFLDIYKQVEEADGVIDEELQEALAINDNDFEERVEAFNIMIGTDTSDIERLEFQKSAIERKIKSKKNTVAYLKEIINNALIKTTTPNTTKAGKKSYKREFPNINVTLVSSPSQSVDILDPEAIKLLGYGKFSVDFNTDDEQVIKRIQKTFPNIEVKNTYQADKTLIGNKLKAGEEVKGAELITKYNLTIK